jgi:glycosyltransferase involved in cell wall biosynthesis
MKPEISVVIPLYNKERYIRRTIDSVLGQTFQNFECIVIDSSTDGSAKLVRQYDDPRILLVSCEKSTAARARNHGASIAQSDLLAFLDADDEWQPDHLETLVRLRKRFPDAGVYSTPYVKIRRNGRPMVMLFYDIPCPPWEGYIPGYLKSCSRGDEPVHSSCCAVPRPIFETIGGFPEDLVYGEDQFLWGKISLTYPVAFSWNGLAIYHTEALGRICDEVHVIREHPFSAYLRQELAKGTIPAEKQRECLAYVRRKRYSEIFSRLLSGGESESSEGTPIPFEDTIHNSGKGELKSSGSINIIGLSLNHLYRSSIHDVIRRCLCKIYGCYDSGQLFYSGKGD